jgi:hypothetical protein
MNTAFSRNSLCLALVGVALLSGMATPKAQAGDLGKVLGAVAVGYLAYELASHNDRARAPAYGPPPPPPPHRDPHPSYNPPSPYYDGRRVTNAYNEGYRDGYTDGNRNGFQNGYRAGDANGYRRGTADGYRWGYGDGYGDGRHDGWRGGPRR